MQAVLGFIEHHRMRTIDHAIGYFDVAVGWQGVHIDRIVFRQGDLLLVGDPVFVFLCNLGDFCGIFGGDQGPQDLA